MSNHIVKPAKCILHVQNNILLKIIVNKTSEFPKKYISIISNISL